MIDSIVYVLRRLEKDRIATLMQFLKFGLVGVSNTAISYGIDLTGYYLILAKVDWSNNVKILVVSFVAFFVSVTNAYYWNNRYVFGKEAKKTIKQHLAAYFKTVVCYGFTGLLLSPVVKALLTNSNVPYWLAGILTLILTIPLNFIMNKFWAFRIGKDA